MDQMNADYNTQLTELTSEVASFRSTSDELSSYVRLLEQNNDDLERANRAASVSIEDFEMKLNQAIERNAFLESELDEKETLKGMVQRLKDETRDLQGELVFKRAATPVGTPQDNKETYKVEKLSRTNSLTPLGKNTPLSVVNDLLRKVGVLESKLVIYNKDHSLRRKLHKDFNNQMTPN